MKDLDIAIGLTLEVEGNWSNHPKDPGGKTLFGITIKTWRRAIWRGIVPDRGGLRSMTVGDARKIYEVMYWGVAGRDLPRGLNALVFDVEVNSGRGGIVLQRALNTVGPVGLSRLVVDGAIGPRTLAGVGRAGAAPDGSWKRLAEVDARRDWWWDRLRINRTFGFGWNRRGSRVLVHAVRMAVGDL